MTIDQKYSNGQDCPSSKEAICPPVKVPCHISSISSNSLNISGSCSQDGGKVYIELPEPEPIKCDAVSELMPNDLLTFSRNGVCVQITFENLLTQLGCRKACL
jgi:hypothetical protein